ncbi:YraN family protein [bacterium]|nr:YraN family protein [bacterium]
MSRKTGQKGETYAASFLQNQGYRLVHQNLYTRYGEIDLVVYKNKRLVFVEVKTRKNLAYGYPEDSFTKRKYRLILRSALEYMVNSHYRGLWQIDLIAIMMNSFDEVEDIRHYSNVTL